MRKKTWLAWALVAKAELMQAGFDVVHNGFAQAPAATALVAWNASGVRLIHIGNSARDGQETDPVCPPFGTVEVWTRDETQPGGWQITILARNDRTP